MNWKDAGAALARIGLPLLGAALPVPGGAALGTALAAMIGPDKDGKAPQTIDDLVARLTTDAEARQRAVEFQAQHHERMTAMVLEHQQKMATAEVTDRADARKASVEGGTSKRLFWLSVVLLAMALGAEIYVLLHGLPAGTSELVVGRVLGLLDAIVMMVLSFWFGSSLGSWSKNPPSAQMK